MPENGTSKWVKAILKLTRLTQEGELLWGVAPPEYEPEASGKVSTAFLAEHHNRLLRVWKHAYKVPRVASQSFFSGTKHESDLLHSEINLDLLSDDGDVTWTFPQTDGLEDLYAAVQYQVAGVSEYLDTLLEEEND